MTVPNYADVATPIQAAPDAIDFAIIAAGDAGTGVVSGCAVTAQGSPNMTVAVAAGTVVVAGTQANVTAGSVTITTADATNPRFDLIVADNTGALTAVAGTPAAVPVFPATSNVVLAAVYVAAGATSIVTGSIVDKRLTVKAALAGAVAMTGILTPSALSADVDDYNPTGLANAGILRLDGSGGFYHINGIAGGTPGRLLYVSSVGANYHQIQLVHEAGTSTAANRLFLPGGGLVNWTIEQDSGIWLIYDGTISRWRILTNSGIYGGSFVTVFTNGGTMTLYGGIGTWTLTNHLRLVIAGITPEAGASLTTNDSNNTVSNPMTMQQSQPTNNTVVYTNCSTVLEGLPLVIPAGQELYIEAGGVFIQKS